MGPRCAALPLRLADAGQVLLFGGYFLALTLLLATDLDQRLLPDVVTLPLVAVDPGPGGRRLEPARGRAARLGGACRARDPGLLFAVSIPFGSGAIGMGDLKLLVSVGLLTGLARSVSGLVVGALAAGVVIGVLLPAPGHAADLHPVRALPDHRGLLGRARPLLIRPCSRLPRPGPTAAGAVARGE